MPGMRRQGTLLRHGRPSHWTSLPCMHVSPYEPSMAEIQLTWSLLKVSPPVPADRINLRIVVASNRPLHSKHQHRAAIAHTHGKV